MDKRNDIRKKPHHYHHKSNINKLSKNDKNKKESSDYKEKTLQARKDHTRLILERQAKEKRRALFNRSTSTNVTTGYERRATDFIAPMKFRSYTPDIPFHPKFLEYPIEVSRCLKYKPNFLERNFIPEIYLGRNMGLEINLIDPDIYELNPFEKKLEPDEEAILKMEDDNAKRFKESESRNKHHTWLRRTAYVHRDFTDGATKKMSVNYTKNEYIEDNKKKQSEEDNEIRLSYEEMAKKSFTELPTNNNIKHPTNKKLKPAKIWDVYPDEVFSANLYSLFDYDILPSEDLLKLRSNYNDKKVVNKATKDMLTKEIAEENDKKIIVKDFTEIKQITGKKGYIGTIYVPQTDINMNDTESNQIETQEKKEKFDHYRDCLIDINLNTIDNYIFMLQPNSNKATYAPCTSRVSSKKTKLGKEHPNIEIVRREYTDKELDERKAKQMEVGGIYDASMDQLNVRKEELHHENVDSDTIDFGSDDSSDENETKENKTNNKRKYNGNDTNSSKKIKDNHIDG